MRSRDQRFGALVQVVASGTLPGGSHTLDELEGLTSLAIRHRVAGPLAAALRAAGIHPPDRLAAATAAATADHLRAMRALSRLGPALDGAGLSWAVVKGPALSTRWPDPITARSYQDLDLLVDPRELRDALSVLERLGFRHRNGNWSGFRALGVGEVPVDDGDVVLDVHWHVVGLQDRREMIHLPTAELLGRAVPVALGGVEVPTLCDLDTLAHLCSHDGLGGAQSLVELRDAHLVAAQVTVQAAHDRLARARVQRLAAVVLDRAERLFGPIGREFCSAAMSGTPGWVALNRGVDALWGGVRRGGWTPFPGSFAKAGRSSVSATSRAVASELRRSIAPRLGRATVTSPGGPLDWTVDAGGADELERYLDDVASGRFGR